MNIAAAFEQITGPAYECTTDGCTDATDGNYCAAHRATCDWCGAERERAELNTVEFYGTSICADCAYGECDRTAGYVSRCFCGQHRAAVAS